MVRDYHCFNTRNWKIINIKNIMSSFTISIICFCIVVVIGGLWILQDKASDIVEELKKINDALDGPYGFKKEIKDAAKDVHEIKDIVENIWNHQT